MTRFLSASLSKPGCRPGFQAAQAGFTLIELAIVIVVVAVIATVAVSRFGQMNIDAEATVVRTAQAQLEQVLTQAAMRMDLSPTQVMQNVQPIPRPMAGLPNTTRETVVELVNRSLGNDRTTVALACPTPQQCTLSFPRSARVATLTVNPNGAVTITGLQGAWAPMQLVNGTLRRPQGNG